MLAFMQCQFVLSFVIQRTEHGNTILYIAFRIRRAETMTKLSAYLKSCGVACVLACVGLSASNQTLAAGPAKPSTADQSYQQQRADCLAGKTAEDQATCLREAGAARQSARRGDLSNGSDYERNALMRCQPLPPDDKADCERRVRGEGNSSGSVGGGGIYRELRTTIPAPDAGKQ
jgi:hypothetical protein